MTIAIAIAINEGIVLTADSVSTVMLMNEKRDVVHVESTFQHASKVFSLHKSKAVPIGAITWGKSRIGNSSIATALKHLRHKLSDEAGDPKWKIDPANYSVAGVAQHVHDFLKQELIDSTQHGSWVNEATLQPPKRRRRSPNAHQPDHEEEIRPGMNIIVGGFSTNSTHVEAYRIEFDSTDICRQGVVPIHSDKDPVLVWGGITEAIYRLYFGISPRMPELLKESLGQTRDEIAQTMILMKAHFQENIVDLAMPIGDAIDLAEFLAETSIKYARFGSSAMMLGGQIEIAAITRHEGFKWVRRKYHYDRTLNSEEDW